MSHTRRRLIYSVISRDELPPELILPPATIDLTIDMALDQNHIIAALGANEDWLRQIRPALTNEQLQNGLGIDLPIDVLQYLSAQYPYQDVQQASPQKQLLGKAEWKQSGTCRRYKKTDDDPYHQKTCAICIDAYRSNQKVVRLNACGHDFHNNCIKRWVMHESATCPVCKKKCL